MIMNCKKKLGIFGPNLVRDLKIVRIKEKKEEIIEKKDQSKKFKDGPEIIGNQQKFFKNLLTLGSKGF